MKTLFHLCVSIRLCYFVLPQPLSQALQNRHVGGKETGHCNTRLCNTRIHMSFWLNMWNFILPQSHILRNRHMGGKETGQCNTRSCKWKFDGVHWCANPYLILIKHMSYPNYFFIILIYHLYQMTILVLTLLEDRIALNLQNNCVQAFIADYFFKSNLAEDFSYADIQASIYYWGWIFFFLLFGF